MAARLDAYSVDDSERHGYMEARRRCAAAPVTARRSLEGWDVDAERRAACEAAYKYMRRRWDDDERRARMLTYGALARRGYSSELARQAVEHAAQRLRDEQDGTDE